jgi:transposase InsO family protein
LLRQALRPVYRRPYRLTTDSGHAQPIAESGSGRCFDGWKCDQAWVGDITGVPTAEGWLYLAVILDLTSRQVAGTAADLLSLLR